MNVDVGAILKEIGKELARPRAPDDVARAALAKKLVPYGRQFYENY